MQVDTGSKRRILSDFSKMVYLGTLMWGQIERDFRRVRDLRVHNCARRNVLHSPDTVVNFFGKKPGIAISEVTAEPWPWSSSSGSPLDYGARGPKFDSRWKLGSFSLSSYLSIIGVPLNRSLMEVQHNWFLISQQINRTMCSLRWSKLIMHRISKRRNKLKLNFLEIILRLAQ